MTLLRRFLSMSCASRLFGTGLFVSALAVTTMASAVPLQVRVSGVDYPTGRAVSMGFTVETKIYDAFDLSIVDVALPGDPLVPTVLSYGASNIRTTEAWLYIDDAPVWVQSGTGTANANGDDIGGFGGGYLSWFSVGGVFGLNDHSNGPGFSEAAALASEDFLADLLTQAFDPASSSGGTFSGIARAGDRFFGSVGEYSILAVPEPGTLALLSLGLTLGGLAARGRRRSRRNA